MRGQTLRSYAQSAASSLAARNPGKATTLGKRALRYLAGAKKVGLKFEFLGGDFAADCDASLEASRSTTGSAVTYVWLARPGSEVVQAGAELPRAPRTAR